MSFLDTDGARLYWKRDGRDEAPALVLLNSIGTDMDLWDAVLPHLRADFALLRIDARGHGASTAEAGDFSMAMLAADVLAVADAAGIERFSLAGVSLGGMIGMELALRAPDRIEKLVPVCTSATMDAGAWNERVTKIRQDGMAAIADLAMGRFLSDQVEPALYEAVRRQLLAMDAQGYAGCAAAIRDMELAPRLSGIACPTLVVTGTRDTSTPFEGHGEHLVAGIPGAAHVSLEAAHLAPLEAPEALASALLSFLKD
ncbi:3-oxoadipate enol-lactonase [Novosphingobium mangrovi (ex Huang et al. 2023)]|uniref:3-oxoadipate enol-lactonase n=1 Tax=Novosphingobium mangrovi (ex Huang et al. 2023) TaxID=2976432 RepID=A0ABT2I9A2_9SPHN|nr:3-oxoadipate enol-lactonase [Novosphingobium mangrovi (ex Huang et al. 2023)]MCT2401409.1 3-oxoadipate enol-lactonase [Novosphingobium mangrovi (ex Huang et al. 2023)]